MTTTNKPLSVLQDELAAQAHGRNATAKLHPDTSPLALVDVVKVDRQRVQCVVTGVLLEFLQHLASAVLAAILDQDNLFTNGYGLDPVHQVHQRVPLVIDGDDHREQKALGNGVKAQRATPALSQEELEVVVPELTEWWTGNFNGHGETKLGNEGQDKNRVMTPASQ